MGAGQTLSMIVGLGDYTGGELCVESGRGSGGDDTAGVAIHDIRYKPLEFDGCVVVVVVVV